MKTDTPDPDTSNEAQTGRVARWLAIGVHLILTLMGLTGYRPPARVLIACERGLKALLYLRAYAAHVPTPGAHGRSYPRRPPPGFIRRPSRASYGRRITLNVLPKAQGWRARLARVLRVLGDLETYVARQLKRLDAHGIGMRTLLARPPARMLISGAPAPALTLADTS